MATLTIAQALATTSSGLTVVDSATNIAAALPNGDLVTRVNQFKLNANGTTSAAQAALLATLGSKFTVSSYKLTIKDSIAALTDVGNSAGLGLAAYVTVFDTAAHILAAASTYFVQHVTTVTISSSATISLANLLTLESLPSLSIQLAQSISILDTAPNLLSVNVAQHPTWVKFYTLSANASVSAASARGLVALPNFSLSVGVSLAVTDTAAAMTSATAVATLTVLAAKPNTSFNVTDTWAHLTNSSASLAALALQVPAVTTVMSDSQTVTAAQLQAVAPALPHFSLALGQSLVLADSFANLSNLSTTIAALATTTHLTSSATASVQQLLHLLALPDFSAGSGNRITVVDAVSAVTSLTMPQQAVVTSFVVQDTVLNLLAAGALPAALAGIVARLDSTTYSMAQAIALAARATGTTTLTLAPTGASQSLHIADTAQAIAGGSATLSALRGDGVLSVIPTDTGATLSAADAAALAVLGLFNPFTYGISVADSGAQVAAHAAQIFGAGFAAINVSSGTISGTLAQLLDPTLHVSGSANVQLAVSATTTALQAITLAGFTGFSRANGITLSVQDTMMNLTAAGSAVQAVASDVTVADTDVLTAAQASALAQIRLAVGPAHFNLAGNFVVVSDVAANLTAADNIGGIALADTVSLAANSLATASQVSFLISLGAKFSTNGYALNIIDNALALALLAVNPSNTMAINGFGGEVVLSQDATIDVATANTLLSFTNFGVGSHRLVLVDSASALLDAASAAAEGLATAVELSAPATVTVAQAIALAAMQGFSTNGMALTITDTPAQLAALPMSVAVLASSETVTAADSSNLADYAISAQQLSAMMALPGISGVGFTGIITVLDRASALVDIVSLFGSIPSGSLLQTVAAALSTDATVDAASGSLLAQLPRLSLGGHSLTIHDTAGALLSPSAAAGIAIATSVNLSSSTALTAVMAGQLISLHGFTANDNAFIVADTPTALAGLSSSITEVATSEIVAPYSEVHAAEYTIDLAQFTKITSLAHLSFNGFSGTIRVADTAVNLGSLAMLLTGAAVGSNIQVARGTINAVLSADADVTSSQLLTLATLPGFSTGGHALTLQDTPSALIAAFAGTVPYASAVTLASNASPWLLSATEAARLAALPNFDTGSAGINVRDTAANLVAAVNAAGVALAMRAQLSETETVNVATAQALHALSNFSLGGQFLAIADSAANLTALDTATASLAYGVLLQGPALVTASQFGLLRALPGFSTNGYALTISDTAAGLLSLVGSDVSLASVFVMNSPAQLTAAQAQSLATLPNLQISAGTLTVADTATHLLSGSGAQPDNWAGELLAQVVVLTADAVITAAQAAQLAQLGSRFSNYGHALIVQDTPTALLANAGSLALISNQISATILASNTTPWVISIAQAQVLAALHNFGAGPSSAILADSAANILYSGNAAIVAAVPVVTLNGNSVVSVADAVALHGLSNFVLGSNLLTITDGGGHLATLDASTAAMASAIQLQGNTIVTVSQFQAIRSLPNYTNNGKLLVISDNATNLLTLVGSSVSLASQIMLNNNPTVSADQAQALVSLANFTTGIAHLSIQDTAAHLLRITGVGSVPDDWTAELTASSVTLTADATLSAGESAELAALGSRFSRNGHALIVSDSAANLLTSNNINGLGLATTITLSGVESNLSASAASRLAALTAFVKGDASVTVSDTAANITFAGYAAGLALADHVQLSAPATLNVIAAEALVAVVGFQNNPSAPVTIVDGFANLLKLESAIGSVIQLMAIGLSDDATVTVAQLTALAALPQYTLSGHTFSTNGHALVVFDTGRHIAGYTPDSIAVPTAYVMSGDATLTASQANILAARNVDRDGNALTVADSPAALLNPSNAVGLAIATGVTVSGDVTLTAAQLIALNGLTAFSTGGHVVTVSDTTDTLLGLSTTLKLQSTSLAMAADETVNSATLASLTQLGSKFSLGGHVLSVSDTAANLAGLNVLETTLATRQQLSQDATISAATAMALHSLPAFDLNGHSLTVSDTATALLDPAYAVGIVALARVQLNSGAALTVPAAVALAALSNFYADPAAPITVVDTLSDLVTLPGNLPIAGIALSADAVATVAQLAALATVPAYALGFSRNGHALVLADSGAHLAAYATDGVAVPTAYVMVGDATVTAAQAVGLASRSVALNGNALTVADTPAALLDSGNVSGLSLATTLTLSADASVAAATASSLAADVRFSTGIHHLTVQDTAAALLALDAAAITMASFLALSASETVDVATLLGLTRFGVKFEELGNTLTVADTAANLVTLNALETDLVVGEVLAQSATVNVAMASGLAALPGFGLGVGVTMTVQDTVANLIGMGVAAQAIATIEKLAPGSSITISAAEGDALAALPHFVPDGATITVSDTVANYGAAGLAWQAIASSYAVVDTLAHIINASDQALLNGAASVTLSGDTQVDAATAGVVAGLNNFAHGIWNLTVLDGPVQIAAFASAILAVATAVRINSSVPITAAAAEALVPLQQAGKLSFVGGAQLVVADSYANLSLSANTAGLMLASILTVIDTPSGLLLAAGHNWGSANPYYQLSAGGSITGAQATTFGAFGTYFQANGQTLTVDDTAAGVAGNIAAIVALGVAANVTDTAAAVGAQVAGLLSLSTHLASVRLTDVGSVSVAQAAALHSLAPVLAGVGLTVADNAAAVDADLANLLALGVHIGSVSVTDSAANVAAVASDLQVLGVLLTVHLNDGGPVSASAAAGLVPLRTLLAVGTRIDVSDTSTAVATNASGLASLDNDLGTVTLSDGTQVTAAVAAAVLAVDGHLGLGVALQVADTASAIAAVAAALTQLQVDGRLSSVSCANEATAAITTYGATLAALGASATIRDNAAAINAALDALEELCTPGGLVQSVTLTDGATPTLELSVGQLVDDRDVLSAIVSAYHVDIVDSSANLLSDLNGPAHVQAQIGLISAIHLTDSSVPSMAMSLAQLAANETVLALIASSYSITVDDTAAAIQSDLALGTTSIILAHLANLGVISVTAGTTIMLSEAEALYPGVGSALARTSGLVSVAITGVVVADIGDVVSLGIAGVNLSVGDTAAHVQADLTSGASVLVANHAVIGSIALTSGGPLTLSVTQLGEDAAVLSLISSYQLQVSDTAGNIEADLASGAASVVLRYLPVLGGVALSGGTTITLSESQAVYSGVATVIGMVSGLTTFNVTDIRVTQIAAVAELSIAGTTMAVADTAYNVQSDLALGSGSVIVANVSAVGSIALSSGTTITLTETQLVAAGVAAALRQTSNLSGLDVTGVGVDQIATVVALAIMGTMMAVSDTAANVQDDLANGVGSAILANAGQISALTLSSGSTISLTESQAIYAGVAGILSMTAGLAGVGITGVLVNQIAAIEALGVSNISMAIADSAANVEADLAAGGNSLILANLADIGSIGLSSGTVIALTASEALYNGVAMALSRTIGLTTVAVTGVTVADIGAVVALGVADATIAIDDSAAAVQDDLARGSSSAILAHLGIVSGIALPAASTITLTEAQATYAGVAAALALVTNLSTFAVTGVTVAQVPTVAALGIAATTMALSDSAADVQADLAAGGSSGLIAGIAHISAIAVPATSTITLTQSQALYTGAAAVLAKISGLSTLAVTGVDVAHLGDVLALGVTGTIIAVSDTVAHVQADLTSGTPVLVADATSISGVVMTGGVDLTLTVAQVTADATALALIDTYQLMIADSAPHVQADLALGAGSILLANLGNVGGIMISGGTTITLTEAQLFYSGVTTVLLQISNLTGLHVTGVSVADIGSVLGLGVDGTDLSLSDSAAHLQDDLAAGASSVILANAGVIAGIVLPPNSTISLTGSQAAYSGVVGELALMSNLQNLIVTGVALSQIAGVMALGVPNTLVDINEAAAIVEADLASGGSSVILSNLSVISGITLPAASTITLTAAQASYSGVGAALMLAANLDHFVVTGASVGDVATVGAMAVPHTAMAVADTIGNIQADLTRLNPDLVAYVTAIASIAPSGGTGVILTAAQAVADAAVLPLVTGLALTIDDTAAHVQADLALGTDSAILGDLTVLAAITLNGGGTITLTESQAVRGGVATALGLATGLTSFAVTGVAVAQIGDVAALGVSGTTMSLNDSAANIEADLAAAGGSVILAHAGSIADITLTSGTTITLTEAQASYAGVAAVLGLVSGLSTFAVTGVTVAQISSVAGLGVTGTEMAIADTAANVQADLAIGGGSEILGNTSAISAITVSGGTTITLSEAQAVVAGVAAAMGKISNLAEFDVTGVDIAQIATVAALGVTNTHMAVSDTVANVQNDLTSGTPTLVANLSVIGSLTVTGAPTINLTVSQLMATGVSSVLAKSTGAIALHATSALVSQISAVEALAINQTMMSVVDTATHVQGDLALGATSALRSAAADIQDITLSGGTVIMLTSTQALYAGVGQVLGLIANLSELDVTAVAVADIAILTAFGLPGLMLAVSDTAGDIEADLALGASSSILNNTGSIGSVGLSSGTAITLTETQAVYSGVASALSGIVGLTRLIVTGVTVAQVSTILALGVSGTTIALNDTAAHVQADLASGGSSTILANIAAITDITIGGGTTITLTEIQAIHNGVAAALALINNLANVAITGVSIGQIVDVTALGIAHMQMAISDSAANLQGDLSLGVSSAVLANVSAISGIDLSVGNTITLTSAQALYAGVATALNETTGLTAFVVTGVAVAQIATVVALAVTGTQITVSDTAAHIQADLALSGSSAIVANSGAIGGVALSSGTIITLTEAQTLYTGVAAIVGAIAGLAEFDVTGVAVDNLAAVLGFGVSNTIIAVSDTAANVQADLTGPADLVTDVTSISSITLTGGPTTLTLSLADITADTATLAKITAYHIAISDSQANIQVDLASGSPVILSHLSQISSIAMTDAGLQTLALSVAQLTADAPAMALITSSYQVDVTDTAAHVQSDLAGGSSVLTALAGGGTLDQITLTDGGMPTLTLSVAQVGGSQVVLDLIAPAYQITVADTAADVQADLAAGASSTILHNGATVTAVTLPASSTITLTEAQLIYAGVDDSGSSALAVATNLAHLHVTGVTVAQLPTVLGLSVVPDQISIMDSVANIVADLAGPDLIGANSSIIAAVTPTDTTTDALSAAAIYNALPGGVTFVEAGLTITDTAGNLLAANSSAPAALAMAQSVTLSANATGVTAAGATALSGILAGSLNGHTLAVADTSTNLLNAGNATGIAFATAVRLSGPETITGAVANALASLSNFVVGPAITLADSITNLLSGSYAAGMGIAATITPNADYTVSASQLTQLATITGYATGGHQLTVQGDSVAILALTQPQLGFTHLVHVADTSATIQSNLDSLRATVTGQGHSLLITLSDGVTNIRSITVTETTYAADAAVIDAITTVGSVKVFGTAAQLAGIASTLASDMVVGEVDVSDTAANILSNLTALQSIGSKFMQATISDTSVNASEVASLLTIPNLVASGLTVADTGAQIALAILTNGTPGLNFMNAATVQLSADSVIAASDAVTLQSLTSFSRNGHSLVVWDTASHLTDSIDGYLAAVSNINVISGVYLKTVGGTATITASTAATLLSIPNFSRNNPPNPLGNGASNTLTVSDTAAHIESNYAAMVAHIGALSGIVVSGSATITDAVLQHLLNLGATTAASLTVRDTASNIYGNALSQVSGSLMPAAWQLSGSATVSEAQAAILGGLAGFSAGAYALTLSADATITITDANQLGVLGTSFKLGGHTLTVNGDVAAISGLTANAKLLVTPNITDTFANVSGLGASSGVLGGTITVSDSEAVTYTQVENFLSLLQPGNASGVATAKVSFGSNIESVTDTLAHLQSLASYALWTAHPEMQSHFHLVVADTVANLINPSNTSALSAMYRTTLNGDQSTTAASAESLFALESTINFDPGSNHITILDTAANILNPVNIDGEALATTWKLSANGTVVAADAETLLTAAKFDTNGHILTIADSSDNLLDGVLSSDIIDSAYAANVLVELAGPETLDATTAHAVVSLPGFTFNGYLSIADSAAYLLNPLYASAESLASAIQLIGDEAVSAANAARLAALPNFDLNGNTLYLASNDYVDLPTLSSIANFGSGFNANGYTLKLTEDALAMTPTQYTSLQSDNIVLNGHALSALATVSSVGSSGGNVQINATGIDDVTLNIYASNGSLLSSAAHTTASFTATASEGMMGNGVVVTEVVGASAATSESAPIIALERTVLTSVASTDGNATFAASGAVQVDVGKYVDIYTAGVQPEHPTNPVLVYDPTAHTLSLDIDGYSPVVLVTLGAATHPATLDATEIFIRHFT